MNWVCFQLSAIVNKAAVHILVQGCVEVYFHFSQVLGGRAEMRTMRLKSHVGSSRVSGDPTPPPAARETSVQQADRWEDGLDLRRKVETGHGQWKTSRGPVALA